MSDWKKPQRGCNKTIPLNSGVLRGFHAMDRLTLQQLSVAGIPSFALEPPSCFYNQTQPSLSWQLWTYFLCILKKNFPRCLGEAMLNWLGRTRVLGAVFCDFALMWKFRCCSVSQSCMTLRPPWTVAPQDPLSSTFSQSLLKHTFIESIMLPDRLILCSALFLLPSIFPSIRVFSNELALHIRCPKCWSFSFSISPSNEGLMPRRYYIHTLNINT